MLPLTPDHDFHTQLAQARLEALAVLRRAMTDQDNPPSKEAIRAAITILRLPKHLTNTPCHAGDEPPPSLSSSSAPSANPRVSSPSPQSPATPEGRCEAHPRVSSPPPRSTNSEEHPTPPLSTQPPSTPSHHHPTRATAASSPPHPQASHQAHPEVSFSPFELLRPTPISHLLSRAGQATSIPPATLTLPTTRASPLAQAS